MKRYDSEAIARYYRFRPWKSVWRAFSIVWSFAWLILGVLSDNWFKRAEANKLKRAIQLRQLLTRLGPTFIKVGQALSTRPDLIRKDFLEELIKLQDQLPPFPTAIAFNIIEQELDRGIDEAFSKISPQPVAAASWDRFTRQGCTAAKK